MPTLGARIRRVLLEKGLTQAELARLIGVKQQTISYICARESPASTSRYTGKIAEVLGVNPGWLQYGEGDRHDPVVRIEVDGEELSLRRVPIYTKEQVLAQTSSGRKTTMPVKGLMTDANVSGDAFAFEITDESMSPKFVPGDRVVIDPHMNPVPGDYVAATYTGQLIFRKFRSRNGEAFELAPLNDDWPVIGHKNARILGVMAEYRSYRKQR